MAPRDGARGEDDGYLLTLIGDLNRDVSECWIFDSSRLRVGPVCRISLPERMSSGTHGCWADQAALALAAPERQSPTWWAASVATIGSARPAQPTSTRPPA
jgi:hypothetical protein